MPNDFPDNIISFVDKKSSDRFVDPTNRIYCHVFKTVWPNVTFISNEETVGDLVEAILGLAWVKNDRGQTLSPEAEDFVNMVEQACLSEYSLQTWYPNRACMPPCFRVVNSTRPCFDMSPCVVHKQQQEE